MDAIPEHPQAQKDEATTRTTAARTGRKTKDSDHKVRIVNLASPDDSKEAMETEEVGVEAMQGHDQHLPDHGPRMDNAPS